MEEIRIAILDPTDQVLGYMDNTASEALHYYDDELHEYLQGNAYTYNFSCGTGHEDSQYIVEGNKIAFRNDGQQKDYYLNILHVEKDEQEIRAECYGLLFELLNEEKEAYAAAQAMTFEQYWAVIDAEGSTVLGLNEVSDKSIKHEWTGSDTVLARMYSLANVFSAEIEFVTELNDDYSLKRVVANVYREHSDTHQGIGRKRTDITLRYGKEISGITKKSDITELYTAIQPTGKDGLTIANIARNEYDSNGNVEYFTVRRDGAIRAKQARDRFPSNLSKKEDGYILKFWSYETDNVEMLYGKALAELKKMCEPQVSYEVEGYFDTATGDMVNIVDEEYKPILYLEARVSEQIRSFTDPMQNKTTFSNFRELQSQINPELLNRVQALVNANRTYTCSIITDNGIVFKNGKGDTTLTASVMDGGNDLTDSMTIAWKKDGVPSGTGKSLTVQVTDIEGKSVYGYEARDSEGILRGVYEVTVSNVNDGEQGTPGKPGADGKTSYTHIAYSNSSDGSIDFSTSDPDREYIGMYTDFTESNSVDPEKYLWSKIKGADGAQGIPGKPGVDGKTPYLHIAYSTAADGSTGFSVTDPTEKTYIGQYTDYTASDSTDPSAYTWAKIKGDTGATGAKGEDGHSPEVTAERSGSTVTIKVDGAVIATIKDGEDGAQGIPGTTGVDGKTPYFHIAYANSADGSSGFSTTDGTNKLYIGQYTDYTAADSTTPSKYTWTKIKGDKGDTGAKGADGQMLYATCGTASATVAKVATLAAGTLTLKAGATVAVKFTYANNAASPTLNISGTGAKAIYTQGVPYAYWAAGSTVIFTYDGTYWRVASEPVYASTATIGNPAGGNIYLDGNSISIKNGNDNLARFYTIQEKITFLEAERIRIGNGLNASGASQRAYIDISESEVAINHAYFPNVECRRSDESVLINSGARQDLKVTFKKAFEFIPVVLATPYTSTGGGVEVAVKDITTTGFTVNMKNGGAAAAYFKVEYLAICP